MKHAVWQTIRHMMYAGMIVGISSYLLWGKVIPAQEPPAPTPTPAQSDAPATGSSSGFSTQKANEFLERISSGKFTFQWDQNVLTYKENVKVVFGEKIMFSDELNIYWGAGGKDIEKAIATGNVRLVSDTITATAEQGIYYNQEQRLDLEGKAKVWQENNTISADRIVAYTETEIVEGYSKEGSADRTVMTVYSQSATPIFGPEETEAENPDDEAGAVPIVIVSDTLKLDNQAQLATFTGDVIATKETSEIRADEMLVYMMSTEESENDIDRIEVYGNVRVKQEEILITGEEGRYLNSEQIAVVRGSENQLATAKNQSMTITAPAFEMSLLTKTVTAADVETYFGSQEEEEEPLPETEEDSSATDEETSEDEDAETDPEDSQTKPSLTLYPGKDTTR